MKLDCFKIFRIAQREMSKKMKKYLIIILILYIGVGCLQSTSNLNTADYPDVKQKIEQQRLRLKTKYNSSQSDAAKLTVLNEARQFLITAVTEELIPYWYGTKWD